MKKWSICVLFLLSFLLYQNCAPIEGNNGNGVNSLNATASYQKVQGILDANCVQCHANASASNRNVGLSSYQAILDSGILVAGNAGISRIYQSISSGTMPQNLPRLSDDNIKAIRDWINLGAPDSEGNSSNDVPVVTIVGGNKAAQQGDGTIEFFAVVNDRDGAVLRTIWTVVGGPSHPPGDGNQLVLAGESSTRLSVSNYIQGTYIFQLLVEDDQRAISTARVNLVVGEADNINPTIVNFDPDPIAVQAPASSVDVTVNANDPDGAESALTYSWSINTGDNGDDATLANATQQTVTVNSLEPNGNNQARYTLNVTVTDPRGGSASQSIDIVVDSAANLPPTASIAPASASILASENTYSVSVSNANDPDGSNAALTYSWSVTAPNGAASPTLSGENTANLTITNFDGTITGESNPYMISVDVTDERGATITTNSQSLVVYAFSFDDDIQPVFTANCVGCHSGPTPSGGLDLSIGNSHGALINIAAINNSNASGFDRVEPGNSTQSELWVRIGALPENDILSMPRNMTLLPQSPTVNMIQTWINDGASSFSGNN